MKKIIIYLLFIFISTNSYSQFYSANISYPLTSTSNPYYSDFKNTFLDGVKFGLSKSYVSSIWFDGQVDLQIVSYGFNDLWNNSTFDGAGNVILNNTVEYIFRSYDMQISHQFKRNVYGNFSIFIGGSFIYPLSNSFKRSSNNDSVFTDLSNEGYMNEGIRLENNYGVSYLADNLINFELGFILRSKTDLYDPFTKNRHNLYLTVGYVIK